MRAIFLSVLVSFSALADEKIEMKFENTIETCLPADVLWQQLSESMVNSNGTWLWPTRLSDVIGEGVQEQAVIDVTYKSLLFTVTYSYELSDITPGQEFTYTAIPEKHPFEGGARVWIESNQDLRYVHWEGVYLTHPEDLLERLFFRSYSRNFFRSLKNNIKIRESSGCF